MMKQEDIYLDYRPDSDHPYAYAYPRPSVTADCILFARREGAWHVLLIRRGGEPFQGSWAFPGGFLETGREDTEQCAHRELLEETGLRAGTLKLVGVFSRPDRDPRCHVVTASYCGIVDMQEPRGGDDAADARWFPLSEVPPLAFDHDEMLRQARALCLGAYTTFILDLDGTLLDTLKDLTAAVNHAFRLHGLPEQNPDDVRRCLGNGYARLIGDLGGDEGVLADFNSYYGAHCADLTAPYDGILQTLAEMKRRGARMAIVSNKGDVAVQQLRAKFFEGLIDIAVGESQTVRRKPNPDAVVAAMQRLGATADEAVYVGDSEVDIETARRAGLPCLSCTWGFRTEEHLAAHGASQFVHAPAELLGFVRG